MFVDSAFMLHHCTEEPLSEISFRLPILRTLAVNVNKTYVPRTSDFSSALRIEPTTQAHASVTTQTAQTARPKPITAHPNRSQKLLFMASGHLSFVSSNQLIKAHGIHQKSHMSQAYIYQNKWKLPRNRASYLWILFMQEQTQLSFSVDSNGWYPHHMAYPR
jgi:hypothetical protein